MNNGGSFFMREVDLPFITKAFSPKDLYGLQNGFSTCELFSGGYINFGYWEENSITTTAPIGKKTRTQASCNLYKKAAEYLNIKKNDVILDIGCGFGEGCKLMFQLHQPQKVIGIDLSEKHINTNKAAYAQEERFPFYFKQCDAENISLPDKSVSKIITVEAIQHFYNYVNFLNEAFRVLNLNGEIVIASFFATPTSILSELPSLIPTITKGIDKIHPIEEVVRKVESIGFKQVNLASIGENVWHGFDKWITQTKYMNTWNRNWLKAYNDNLIDYYIIHAIKPNDLF